MNTTDSVAQTDKDVRRFLSLAAFRDAHSSLMQDLHAHGNTPEFFAEVEEFIQSGRKLGELLDSGDDRWAAQSLLDYWATVLFRADYDAPDVTLAEFDLNLAPNLDTKLCPYRGLEAFQEEDQHIYFGRQRAIDKLLKKLQENQLLAVVGPSGSGKSSLIRAGLLPRLKSGGLPGSEDWKYYQPMVPGSNPLETLVYTIHPRKTDREQWIKKQVKNLLENPNHLSRLVAELGLDVPTVFVIDQFEEIFTLCSEDTCRQAFVNNLLGLIQVPEYRHTVILTMRRDFVERVPQLPHLHPLFDSSADFLMPILPEELREAIEEPANLIGLKYEDGVVDALIGDVRGDEAALPLLQFVLLKLWDNKTRNRITMEAYQGLGGAHEALQKSADELYSRLSKENKDAAKYIFVRLSRRQDKGQEVTRDRLQLKSLYEDGIARDRIERVLDMLVGAHLVRLTKGDTEEDTLVEIAHEALIRNWTQLADWLYEDRDNIRRRIRLTEAAEQWDATGRDPSILWRGLQLEDASHYKGLSSIEVEFIQVSQAAIKAEQERENARRVELETAKIKAEFESKKADDERENAEKFRKLFQEREAALTQAQQEWARAEKQARLAFSRELAAAAINNLNIDPERSILLAIYAVSITNSVGEGVTPEAEDALHRAVQASRVILSLSGHTDQVRGVAFSPDGKRLATASQDNTVKVWDTISGKELFTLSGHTDGVLAVTFSPDGMCIATASRDRTARVWHINSGRIKGTFKHAKGVFGVAFSPNGMSLATASEDETAKIWDIASGKMTRSLSGHTDRVNGVAFSPDGIRLATVSKDKTVKIWDVRSGELLDELRDERLDRVAHNSEAIDVAFNPNGKYLVTTGQDNIKIWKSSIPREKVLTLAGHGSWVESVAFSRNGKYLATGSEDGTAKVWDFDDIYFERELFTLAGHLDRIYKVAFSPDGKRLATAGRDGVVKVWNLSLSQEAFTLLGHEQGITNIKYSPDGTQLATTSGDRTAKIWDIRSGQLLYTLAGHTEPVIKIAFSPDGTCLATASRDTKVVIWDARSGNILHTLPAHSDCVFDVTFSPDGKFLATASKDGSAKVWDSKSYTLLYEFKHTKDVYGIVFSPPDGRYIATASEDRTVKVWDGSSGQELQSLRVHIRGVRSIAFGPDGTRLLTGSYDNTAKVLDPSNGQVLHTLLGHTESVIDVAFSPDGKHVATASEDRTAKVWEVESGQDVLTLSGHTGKVRSVAFSPDGRCIASASQDGTIRVYILPIEDLLALAQKRVTRSLRPDECQKYLRQEECPSVISAVGGSTATALWLIVRGRNLARGGDITGAIASFQKAQDLDSRAVDFDPETEAKRLASYVLGEQELSPS